MGQSGSTVKIDVAKLFEVGVNPPSRAAISAQSRGFENTRMVDVAALLSLTGGTQPNWPLQVSRHRSC